MPEWRERKPVSGLYRLREHRETIVDETNEPRIFEPSWAFRQHRQWWAHRAISFPGSSAQSMASFCCGG